MPMKRPRALAATSLAAFLALAAGCQTASLEDAAPTAAASTVAAAGRAPDKPLISMQDVNIPSPIPLPRGQTALPQQDFVGSGMRDTGRYPSVGVPRQAANSQLTPAEQAAMLAEMERLKAGQGPAASSQAEYDERLKRLRDLAGSHAAEAEREIVN